MTRASDLLLTVHVCPHGIENGADANEWIGDQTCCLQCRAAHQERTPA